MRVAAAALDKAHMDDVVAFRIGFLDLLQELGVDRVPFLLQDVERKGDVGRRHLRAVEETGLRAQPKTVVQLVGRNPHRLRKQAVDGIGLVAVGGHQRVEGRRHARRAIAFPAIDIERVESLEILVAARTGDLQGQQAAGRRGRVDVSEMRKVWRQSEIAERRQAVRLDGIVGERGEGAPGERRERSARAGLQRGSSGQCHGHRIVGLVARFARCTAPRRSSPATAAKTRRQGAKRVGGRVKLRP